MFNAKTATVAEMNAVLTSAMIAGREAANKANPEMIGIAGRPDYGTFPICGFAWVNVKPGNSRFAKYLVANGHASKDSYSGGVMIWIRDYNQSYDLKAAHAYAMATVLNGFGIKAYAQSRLD